MTGYISIDDLNQELQDLINSGSGSGSYINIEPMPVTTEYDSTNYPEGTSTFSIFYNPTEVHSTDVLAENWLRELFYLDESDDVPKARFTVTTNKETSGERPLILQTVTIIKDGIDAFEMLRTIKLENTTYSFDNFLVLKGDVLNPVKMVKLVNHREPDEEGNVNTDFRIIEPLSITEPPTSYPEGNSEFIVPYDLFGLPLPINSPIHDTSDENTRFIVRTYKSTVNNVYIQEIDNDENGIYDPTYYRYSNDGLTWSELLFIDKVKSINGYLPDENYNVTLPEASTTLSGLVQLTNEYSGDSETLAVTQKALKDAISNISPSEDGVTWYSYPMIPDDELGNNGDWCVVTSYPSAIYFKWNGTWRFEVDLHATTWYSLTTDPDEFSNGVVNDYTINTTTGDYFRKGAGQRWFLQGNMYGKDGLNGKDGSKWFNGIGSPSSVDGVDNDYYLDGSTGNVWKKENGQWQDTTISLKGTDGLKGKDGTEWFIVTSSSPANIGKAGDLALLVDTGEVLKKDEGTGNTWTNQGSLKGTDGSKWYYGNGNPNTLNLGAKTGDMYLEYGTGNIWYKTEGDWNYNNGTIRGNKWFTFTTNPPNNSLLNGDLALKSDGSIWRYADNVWVDTGININGEPISIPNMTQITDIVLFSKNTRENARYHVISNTTGRLPDGMTQAYVEIVIEDTGIDGLIGKHYFLTGFSSLSQETPPTMTMYWGFEEIDTEYDTIIEPLNYWIPMGGSSVEITNNLTTTTTGTALDAVQGKILNDNLNNHKEVIASESELGHVMVDGESITIDSNGVISAITSSNYKETFDIDKLPNEYPIGKSDAYVSGSNDSYLSLLNAMNSYFGWQVLNGDVVFLVTTVRNSHGEVTQDFDIYYTKAQAGKKFGSLSRVSNFAQTSFGTWRGNTVILYGNNSPSMAQYGMKGNLYINGSTGDVYKMGASVNYPTMVGWSLLVPKVLNTSDAITPPEGEDYVFSAEIVKDMIDEVADDLASHETVKATDSILGHVKVDGTTIISTDGVISAPNTSIDTVYRIDNDKELTSFFSSYQEGLTVTTFPKGGATYQGVTSILNGYLTWTVSTTSTVFDYVMETFKSGDIGRQDLKVYYKVGNYYYLLSNLTRSTAGTATGFSGRWTINTIIATDIPDDGNDVIGMYGMIKYEPNTGKMYRNTSKTTPSASTWILINNSITVSNNLTTTTTGTALDAIQGKVLNDTIVAHELVKATDSILGHVKVDGVSIISNDGVISALNVSDNYRIDNTKEISSTFSTYEDGLTITVFQKSSHEYQSVTSVLNGYLTWTLNPVTNMFDYVMETFKTGDTCRQDLKVYYKLSNYYYLVGSLSRGGNSDETGYGRRWNINTIVTTDIIEDGNDIIGMYGMIKYVPNNGKLYRSTATSTPSATAWIPLNPDGTDTVKGMVKISDSYDNVSTDTALSLTGANNLFTVFQNTTQIVNDNLTRLLNIHELTIASDNDFGHVRVDGETIQINSNGFISVNFEPINSRLTMVESEATVDRGHLLSLELGFNDHLMTRASDTSMGHVQVDGVTITSADGIISAVLPSPQQTNEWFSVSTSIDNSEGVDGDFALVNSTGDIYHKENGVWVFKLSIKPELPDATVNDKGVAKLYDRVNTEVDGGITPRAVDVAIQNVFNTIPMSYKLNVLYDRKRVLANATEVTFQITRNNYPKASIEVYDDGLLLVPYMDYLPEYDDTSQLFKVTLMTPKTHNADITIKTTYVIPN